MKGREQKVASEREGIASPTGERIETWSMIANFFSGLNHRRLWGNLSSQEQSTHDQHRETKPERTQEA